jgi:hypothetical protein
MRAAARLSVAMLSAALAGAAAAQGQPAREPPPPQGEPDAAAEPPAPVPPGARIDPAAPTDAYDSRVRQSFAAAQSFQGPLDGGWTLSATGEGQLYALRFVDRGGRLEAAWRDLRRKEALGASGFVDQVERSGRRLTLGFSPTAGVREVATLTAGAGNVWTGQLDENGRKRAVALAKTSP